MHMSMHFRSAPAVVKGVACGYLMTEQGSAEQQDGQQARFHSHASLE